MPGAFTAYLNNKLIGHVFSAATYSPPATLYLGLLLDTGLEVSGGSYARVSVTNDGTKWTVAANQAKNATLLTFPTPTAPWGNVAGFFVADDPTAGNTLASGDLTQTEYAFSADSGGEVFTAPGHTFVDNDPVRLGNVPGGTLPTGVAVGTTYFVVNAATDTFKLSASLGGSAINLTTKGTGRVAKQYSRNVGTGDTVQFDPNALTFTLPSGA